MAKPKQVCPKCGKKEAVEKDCGYSAFNPVWVECPCGYRLDGTMSNWNRVVKAMNSTEEIPKRRQKLADTLARLLTIKELEELIEEHGKTF